MARRFVVRGVVQGVGFRPFVYRLAHEHGLSGWVVNSSRGVVIEADGSDSALAAFERGLSDEAPVLARIDDVASEAVEPPGVEGFEIRASEHDPADSTLICPDVAVCPDCLAEFLDPSDRRYHYPFINCTNCGPRLSIIEKTPYDRPKTSMRSFRMCPSCQKEYDDPLDRRFHAQPNACPECGPGLSLLFGRPLERGTAELVLGRSYVLPPERVVDDAVHDPAAATRWLLKRGAIVGVKGLGGFHIAASAELDGTVRALREKKDRPAKPFALMCRSIEVARELAEVDPDEEALLTSPWSPVVLLAKRSEPARGLSPLIAPNNSRIGLMLPYAPLHHLLFDDELEVLVMTSANAPGEPIIACGGEARARLSDVTRTFLDHDRGIVNRNDDSVVFVESGRTMMSRRSRGYAPYPIDLGVETANVLACGTELKSTFTLLSNGRAFVSQHIGDLENQPTLDLYEEMVDKFLEWFRFKPEVVAYDLHPDYLATRFAKRFASERVETEGVAGGSKGGRAAAPAEGPAGPELIGVQHHHAHIASVMAENRVAGPVVGLALDGTGYGTDGKIWGGEFLVADERDFERAGHIRYVPLPGGDAAIRHPYRVALSHLNAAGAADLRGLADELFGAVPEEELDIVVQQTLKGLNCTDTSSAGRLFDAVSALMGVCHEISYEAQAAIELESLTDGRRAGTDVLPYDITEENGELLIDPSGIVLAVLDRVRAGEPPERIATAFHETVVAFSREVCGRIADARGIRTVALSGGVFQNRYLLRRLSEDLTADGFDVLLNEEVPTNDGGVSLGQAFVASARARRG